MKRKRRRGNGEGTVFEDKKNKRWIGQYIAGTSADEFCCKTIGLNGKICVVHMEKI